jgi:uncharacterized membrane protein YjgN (DUF898 family)
MSTKAEIPSPMRSPVNLAYLGQTGEAWRLALKTTFLTVITLGIYRFWAKTRLRSYFWSRLTLDGEPLEYAGTGLELFLGFLIVIVIFIPLSMLASFGAILAGNSVIALIALEFLPFIVIMALLPIAVFRARRYRLSRTLWRGVRAGQTGKASAYWIRAVGYGVLGYLTLGALRPLAHVRLTEYLMQNTWFGTDRFDFQVHVRDLAKQWAIFWVFSIVAAVSYLYGFLSFMAFVSGPQDSSIEPPVMIAETLGYMQRLEWLQPYIAVIGGVAMIGAALTYVAYRVHMVRVFTAGTWILDVGFHSRIGLWWLIFIAVVLVLAYIALFVGAFISINVAISVTGSPFIAIAIVVIAVFMTGSLFAPLITHPMLAHYIETMTVLGGADLDQIVQNAETAPKLGEGLASVFDVDAL